MGVILELPRRSTDQEDENKAVKSFSELLENSSLSKTAYIYYEVLFRQLMMCDEAKTGIRYDLDEPKAHFFCGKLDPQERIKRIESFLSSHRNKSVYAFNRLTFVVSFAFSIRLLRLSTLGLGFLFWAGKLKDTKKQIKDNKMRRIIQGFSVFGANIMP